MGKLKYLFVFTLPALAYISFHSTGWKAYLPVLEAFALIPLLELLFTPDNSNLSPETKEEKVGDRFYRFVLRLCVPTQLAMGYVMLVQTQGEMETSTFVGRILSYGMLCGVMGINVAHELGHKRNKTDQFLSKVLLTSTLYTHFFLEHNYGHHKHVGTKDDPSTARRGEWVYQFWFRSIAYSYLSAWHIGTSRSKGNILKNEMVWYTFAQIAMLAMISNSLGSVGIIAFIGASVTGWIMLETVQYIEHYGLTRVKVNDHRYEDVNPSHSWNSNHQMGRAILFELSRHSDHHYLPHKDYVELDHHDNSPQLPTGYPGMMLISLVPPLYFYLVHKRIS
ncbi:MAG: alkane 1-monooxygenase [Schleiferiaceae bacterium]|nr:alkane 1-monooxygenase [Schleiferiaceae bacterium]